MRQPVKHALEAEGFPACSPKAVAHYVLLNQVLVKLWVIIVHYMEWAAKSIGHLLQIHYNYLW